VTQTRSPRIATKTVIVAGQKYYICGANGVPVGRPRRLDIEGDAPSGVDAIYSSIAIGDEAACVQFFDLLLTDDICSR
jgi:hypothetical protein